METADNDGDFDLTTMILYIDILEFRSASLYYPTRVTDTLFSEQRITTVDREQLDAVYYAVRSVVERNRYTAAISVLFQCKNGLDNKPSVHFTFIVY